MYLTLNPVTMSMSDIVFKPFYILHIFINYVLPEKKRFHWSNK